MKTNLLFATAFVLGATAIVWMGASFVGSDILALGVTVVIGFVYLLGIAELLQFRRASATLTRSLDGLQTQQEPPLSLSNWLDQLHPSLRNAVRARIEGERVGLPAPVFTPYLVGLLIMLGLLGTFVGMVDTLQGAVVALQDSADIEKIRNGLTAPIKGLGLAFGTSVAGVAASAMLGLNATLSRRERMLATRWLDGSVQDSFREHSLPYQQQQTFQALQMQAHAIPQLTEKLQGLAIELERMGQTVSEQLIGSQNQFHDTAAQHYQGLAQSVGDSLQQSLSESGRLAGENIKPIVTEAMAQLTLEAKNTHTHINSTTKSQLEAIAELLKDSAQTSLERQVQAQQDAFNTNTQTLQELTSSLTDQWQQAGEKTQTLQESIHQQLTHSAQQLSENAQATSTGLIEEIGKLLRASESLVEARAATESSWLNQQDERLQQLTCTLNEQLNALRTEEEARGEAARARLEQLESTAAEHIKALGCELEQPMARLIETASETPRAASEVISKLREEISNSVERDNQLLEDRQRVMQDLEKVSGSLQQASTAQSEAIDTLVNSSSTMLQQVSQKFTDHLATETNKISELTANVAGGAVEMASLGDSFSVAIELFNESNRALIENLSRIEESMDKSTARSDDQMSYYIAQAREIIDHSMLSQREIIDELRGIGENQALLPAEAS